MARSSSIWIIRDGEHCLIAAFTVRHEMETFYLAHAEPDWWITQTGDGPRAPGDLWTKAVMVQP